MGFMDDLKKLTKPYTEDDDDFDEFDDDARPSHAGRRALCKCHASPKPPTIASAYKIRSSGSPCSAKPDRSV